MAPSFHVNPEIFLVFDIYYFVRHHHETIHVEGSSTNNNNEGAEDGDLDYYDLWIVCHIFGFRFRTNSSSGLSIYINCNWVLCWLDYIYSVTQKKSLFKEEIVILIIICPGEISSSGITHSSEHRRGNRLLQGKRVQNRQFNCHSLGSAIGLRLKGRTRWTDVEEVGRRRRRHTRQRSEY